MLPGRPQPGPMQPTEPPEAGGELQLSQPGRVGGSWNKGAFCSRSVSA